MRTDPPHSVPPELWEWTCAQLGVELASDVIPSVAIASAAQRSEVVPDRILVWWAYFLDNERRMVDQYERGFIERAREAGWTAERIKESIPLDEPDTLDARLERLKARIYRKWRPPLPGTDDTR